MEDVTFIKQRLAKHVKGGEAFTPVEEMLKFAELNMLGVRPEHLPYSFYEIFHHIRFTQKDILDYYKDPSYKAPSWPKDYWPDHKAPPSSKEWEVLKDSYFEERAILIQLILNEENELFAPFNQETDHTLFREVLLIIEHTAYHTGQLLLILRELGRYPA